MCVPFPPQQVFVTRAWRWMRLSLMGSRFMGRENSSHPGSSKKASRIVQPPDKPIYRPTFKGVDEAEGDMGKGVVLMVEMDSLIAQANTPALAHDSLVRVGVDWREWGWRRWG
ncbi:hypothetical protein GWK47_000286 [Chionoecetes opilio]|uniref:Uncharacterized protein n=1 Tax=Chionoecetes opilio TaxID=41210 RepID=A0A8J5CS69_CHIOP|nr:hypothetical protein GWK47_000286 [Chionoecetes opilio]